MSGHSKWATTKHKKAVIDAKRGKMFAKLIKNIEVAARVGGADPSGNPTLYDAIQKAKKSSVPNDNIDRAVKRGAGADQGGANYETIMYEAYGPGAVAILIECLTDNRNRAVSDVRVAVTRNGGTMADSGSVQRLFSRKGVVVVAKQQADSEIGEDDLLEATLDAGPEEITDEGDTFEIISDPNDTVAVRKAVEEAGLRLRVGRGVVRPVVHPGAHRGRPGGQAVPHHRRPRGLRRRAERLLQRVVDRRGRGGARRGGLKPHPGRRVREGPAAVHR